MTVSCNPGEHYKINVYDSNRLISKKYYWHDCSVVSNFKDLHRHAYKLNNLKLYNLNCTHNLLLFTQKYNTIMENLN